MSMKTKISDEVLNEIEAVGKQALGSEEHVKTVQAVNSMVDRLQKADEIELERQKLEVEERRLDIEEKKLKQNKWVDILKVGATTALGVGYAIVQVAIYVHSFRKDDQGEMPQTEGGRNAERKLFNLTDKFKIF